jgi:acetyltransferase-like isoleucine patch superfamily enzyme
MIGGIGGPARRVIIGDQVTIGEDVRILAHNVVIGDYVTLHNHTTIYGYDDVSIGECTWVGQNAILNCSGPLRIGRGCTISAYSNLWTHFSGGDTLQGCRYGPGNIKPCTLADDVWIGVQACIAPVSIGEKALVLAGAIVTKDIPANTTWGGNPAQDLTAKLGAPFAEVQAAHKYSELRTQLQDFQGAYLAQSGLSAEEVKSRISAPGFVDSGPGYLRLGGICVALADAPDADCSVFDVRDRMYSKRGSAEEIAFMRYLLPTIKFWARGSL